MAYRQLPYALRYLVALVAWTGLMVLTLALKFILLCMVPIILVWTKFGLDYNQQSAQATASLADLLLYGWPRFPRADWRLFIGRRGGSRASHLIQ